MRVAGSSLKSSSSAPPQGCWALAVPETEAGGLGWGGGTVPRMLPAPALPCGAPGPAQHPSLSQMQEEYAMVDRDRDLEGDFEEEDGLEGEPESEEGAQGGVGRKGSVQEAGAMELEEDMELEEEMEQEAEGYKHGGRRRTFSLDELFEEELMAQLEEYERVIKEVQFELEDTRRENSLATGRLWEDAEEGPAARAQQLTRPGPTAFAGQAGWEDRGAPCPQPAHPSLSSSSR